MMKLQGATFDIIDIPADMVERSKRSIRSIFNCKRLATYDENLLSKSIWKMKTQLL